MADQKTENPDNINTNSEEHGVEETKENTCPTASEKEDLKDIHYWKDQFTQLQNTFLAKIDELKAG